jgi:hypothetical protein
MQLVLSADTIHPVSSEEVALEEDPLPRKITMSLRLKKLSTPSIERRLPRLWVAKKTLELRCYIHNPFDKQQLVQLSANPPRALAHLCLTQHGPFPKTNRYEPNGLAVG